MKPFARALITSMLVAILTACSTNQTATTTVNSASSGQAVSSNSATASNPTSVVPTVASIDEALASKATPHDTAADLAWQHADLVEIKLNDSSISANNPNVKIDGTTATISAAGSYQLSGKLSDGQIIVNTTDQDLVRLILNGVTIHSSSSAPIAIMQAEQVAIILADDSQNTLSDTVDASANATTTEDLPNATLYSKADLSIDGNGSLTIQANGNDGISSKDGLIINSGTINITALDDGLRGKDYLVVNGGTISINAQGDGLTADNEEDPSKGYISIAGGKLNVTAGGDGLSAITDILIDAGELTISAGGGSSTSINADASAKGLKAGQNLVIAEATITIDAAEDAIHSDSNVTINAGTIGLAAGDDGVHADATLTINGGDLTISNSYEGLESAVITINAGNISLVAQDDGVNVAGGDGSSMQGASMGRPGRNDSFAAGNYFLYINGGTLVVDAAGDGLDANGSIVMNAGLVLVHGPTAQMNGALDYDGGFALNGGTLVAAGSAGMVQAPDSNSTQASVLINYSSAQAAGNLVQILDQSGQALVSFTPRKQYQALVFSSPALQQAASYTINSGGTLETRASGYAQTTANAGGTAYATFSVSEIVTQVGQRMGRQR
ncbi:carbohydrate-binding domain-containing protein [Herpetosiphon sp. NSE202]|uniref:carbohydrate-binding domain-containing protein n=1 Tax=Herpetosiphon sp. NSE202 TaxID=3351349 RepID=UPI00363F8261